jgi:Ni2+-binding GTPase involved in maturation of urease and hydrogenase
MPNLGHPRRSVLPVTTVTLFGRPGCCLCDDARAVLEQLRDELEFTLLERDITLDDDLHRAYLERIPVVQVAGVEVCELVADEAPLRKALTAALRPAGDATPPTHAAG